MGKLGRWITNETDAPFYARKKIVLAKEIKKATALVCGLGQFAFMINGEKVGDHVLDPGWTNYNKIIQYVTFDVTKYLVPGSNVIGAEVGNGWFLKNDTHYTFHFPPFMPPNPNPYQPFGKVLVLSLRIEIIYQDGTVEEISADDTFKVKKHPVIMSNVYGSETIDGRLIQKGWGNCEFDDSDWESAVILTAEEEPKGKLLNQSQPPVKIIKTYNGTYLHEFENRKIYDLTQNISGILEVEVKGRAGEVLMIYPAEKLTPEGDADQMAKGWMLTDSCITYMIGEDDVWEKCTMKFTYFAGRFLAVAGRAEIRNIKGHAISSAFVRDGSFTCDDQRFNQIYDMVEKSVEANMLSVHTDCPAIERFAWQEVNHLMAPSIMYMKNGKTLWEKFLMDMRTDQHCKEDYFMDMQGGKFFPGDGLVPAQCPCYLLNVLPVPDMGSFYDITPWGSSIILGAYWHYTFYGDINIIKDNYSAGMKYLNHLKTKVNEDGFLNHGLGDWGNPENHLARENIETAFLYADTITLARFADILGKQADKKELEAYAVKVRDNYNDKLLTRHEDGFVCYKVWDHTDEVFLTQASQALPLYWGMVPMEIEEDIIKALRHTLVKKQALSAGEIGLPYVIQSARKYNMNDLVCQYILREEHPGYYAFIMDGETTLGEYWEKNPRSHCHDMMGHIIEWYYNGIAGIIPVEPGFRKILIRPYMPDSMNEFECSYQSVHGKITVSARRAVSEVELSVSVPKEIDYTIDRSNL